MYILIAIVGYFCLAITNIFDKFILSKAVPKAAVFVLYSTIFLLPIFLLIPLGAGWLADWFDYSIALIAGFAFSFALWSMYIGFQTNEVSHGGPLVGASIPFFVLFLSAVLLGERLFGLQIGGIFVLIMGSLLISLEKIKGHNIWHKSNLWLVLSGLLFALSHVTSKYIYDVYGFYTGLVWTRGFIGVFGILLLFYPEVFRNLTKPRKTDSPSQNKKTQFFLVFFSRILAVAAVLFVQYATALGSVTIVSALSGAQFIFLIIMVALLTKFYPALFKEKFVRGELRNELLAVLVIAIGLAMVLI